MSNPNLTAQQAAATLVNFVINNKKEKELKHQSLIKIYEPLFDALNMIKDGLEDLDIGWAEYNLPLSVKSKHTNLWMRCAGFYLADSDNCYILTKDGELLMLVKEEYLIFNEDNLDEFDSKCGGVTNVLVTLNEALDTESKAMAALTVPAQPGRQLN